MNLDELARLPGEWLRGTGPESDVVVSSRIRLARNLASFPFTNRASAHQKGELESLIRDRFSRDDWGFDLTYLPVHNLSPVDREFLRERQLLSRELAGTEGPRGLAFEAHETRSVMVNEEDHLRLQVLRSGFQLDAAWQDIDNLDDKVEERVAYAFSEEFGYLTACPTNVGTGMRASVMLHLPALQFTKQLEKVFRALQKINLAVRGLYGEGTRASGDFYQISNQVTLGKDEGTILKEIREVIPQIIHYEREARKALVQQYQPLVQDKVSRAYGTLKAATMMSTEEMMDLLSTVRLGVSLEMVEDLTIPALNMLFLQTQPSHLTKLTGKTLTNEEHNVERATYLRKKLGELSHQN
jgi:protein arginine kinase